MPGLGDFVKKAFYMGVGVASYAGEKAGSAIADLRPQAQKLANEMVERGEITAEEAKRMVEEIVNRAQQQVNQQATETHSVETLKEPRRIEIVDDEEPEPSTDDEQVNELRDQVNQLKEELKRLQKD
ncbi:hypothetical protein PN466_18860 [Roseofilum reptotaenium CS-1145]|uniref:Phasin family protein n=1 Tax=Roseofilum reptotaenium AO1-A TaxID=1925591 RepID=A0A1L9QTV7_9CYAN|nr:MULTISPECIES: hypothetical protein [Roseofilum]MBP0028398.1 hypothetical protein [Roseofilum sp. Guam]MDB9519009.1 hypothetical protein [Roseofilum reptotaenium CS-1145]OJJ26056.1 hypothetical protein BI308_08635 [Roseofilum reptotaenium AO1-A]